MRRQLFSQPWGRAVSLWAAPSIIQSVQYGTIASNNTSATYTATITAVDTVRTILIPLGRIGGTTQPHDTTARLSLTNATTVTLTFHDATNATETCGFVAVEVMPGLFRSIQHGTVTIAAGTLSNTATITEVNTAKAFPIFLGNTFQDTGVLPYTYASARVVLTNGTTVTASREATTAGTDAVTAGFIIVEPF